MDKDEMKNRISMALKEPILQQGFECICKENAELKKRLKEHESVGDSQFWKNVWAWKTKAIQLANAKEIILKLYNAGRDTLMCPTEEAFNRLSDAINDRSIEQFLSEVEK